MVRKTVTAAGTVTTVAGVIASTQLLHEPLSLWVSGFLVITLALCVAAERLVSTFLRVCDLIERVEKLRAARVRRVTARPSRSKNRRRRSAR